MTGQFHLNDTILDVYQYNIATIRLPATRELYRWFNPATGHYFFTNDAGGEGVGRKGYQFEGIVGFVMR
jgi:hypothetical protein